MMMTAGSIIIGVALALGGVTDALVPADPIITPPAVLPRQNNDRFIGWVESDNTWFSETCSSGLTWYQDEKYAQCCATTLEGCPAPTACVQGTMVYPLPSLSTTISIACTENYNDTRMSICNTAFIFENTGDSNPKTDIVCGVSALNWSYYRSIPASATEVIVSSNAFSFPQVASSGINAPTRTARPSTTSIPSSSSSTSKAWIAGAVIGPIVGLVILGLAIFFLLRRRKNKKNAAPPPPPQAAMNYGPSSNQAPMPYTDTKQHYTPSQGQAYMQQNPPPVPQPYGQTAQNDAYAQHTAYNAQHGYNTGSVSPVPQYTLPLKPPQTQSPPPPHSHHQHEYYNPTQDTKHASHASELNATPDRPLSNISPSSPSPYPPPPATSPPPQTHALPAHLESQSQQIYSPQPTQAAQQGSGAVEMGDNLRMVQGEAYFDGVELAGGGSTPRPGGRG
ncbi:hypothetical protein IAQ61_010816 [Plenodomus lingam]|uniref:Predicted protein n=1 Tax=Leptosphaeria maculans (strain JN3 / isolate v23.1.3 / race Av1-4-5-6-7-8) TaxID=985895 RepID=E4ZJ38_LEPMJ|nr:predicted protein [Plenodomus lingam JN3]KAH9861080.1 hypothetical protein IAQ61_010816 [Plenodomus lingam]CBX91469.1 predicted protein [Plenodomus lingam JN3]